MIARVLKQNRFYVRLYICEDSCCTSAVKGAYPVEDWFPSEGRDTVEQNPVQVDTNSTRDLLHQDSHRRGPHYPGNPRNEKGDPIMIARTREAVGAQ